MSINGSMIETVSQLSPNIWKYMIYDRNIFMLVISKNEGMDDFMI